MLTNDPENIQETIQSLCPHLQPLLAAELDAGNEIVEVWRGWPHEQSIFLSLDQPFLARPDVLPTGVEHRDVNDPHHWKAEYHCPAHQHVLVCRFSH